VDAEAKREWVARVLNVKLASPDNLSGNGVHGPLMPIWVKAKDEVDSRLTALQHLLRQFGDPDLDRIAEFGLNGATGKKSVGLMAALSEADAPGVDANARKKLASAIEGYRAFLNEDAVVGLLDENPFGASPQVRKTLGGALDTLAQRIAG
jgi:hypothetical protein